MGNTVKKGASVYKEFESDFDPSNIVVTGNYALATMAEAEARYHYTVTGANNQGSITSTARTVPISFVATKLACHIFQASGETGFRLYVHQKDGTPVARTAAFTATTLGENFFPIAEVWDGSAWVAGESVQLTGGELYYFGIYSPQSGASVRFLGIDAGTTFGPLPWIAWTVDNLTGGAPGALSGGYESSVRYLIIAAA